MVIKSLTITQEAYDALKRMKLGDESFSEVIIRISNDKRGVATKFFGCLSESSNDLDNLQEKVKAYRRKFNSDLIKRTGNI